MISFEPSVENVGAIQKNIETNNINNVDVRQKIIGEKSGQNSFFKYVQEDSGTSYVASKVDPADNDWREMMTFSLDEELADVPKIKLVKLDIEGFEVAALRGAEKTLRSKKVKYWIVEYVSQCLARNGESLDSLRKYMGQFDLQMFVLDYEGGFPKLYPPNVFLGGKFLNNLLFANVNELGADWVYDDTTFLSSPRGGTAVAK